MHQISLKSAMLCSAFVWHLLLVGCANPNASPRVAAAYPALSQAPADLAALRIWRSADERSLATVRCAGGLQCRFSRLNDMQLLDLSSGLPTEAAQKAAVFRYESMSQYTQSLYHLAVAGGLHELRLQFYPVTLERAEQFTLIHQFKAAHDYQLNLFRDRKVEASSLFAMAAPNPLCVDLTENRRVIRRFCRPFDPKTGLGEFIETRLLGQAI